MKSLINLLGVAAIAVTFTSCLKDKKIDNQEYGITNIKGDIVELPAGPDHVLSHALKFENKDSILAFATISIASDKPVAEDVTITLTKANSATMIADYNTSTGGSVVPFSLYTAQGAELTVTIPKGSREGYVKFKVNPSTFDPSSTYGIGYTIASISNPAYKISGNFNKVLILIGAKNKYDGRYLVTGTLTDANGLYHGEYPTYIDLITVSGNTVIYYQHDYAYPNYIVLSNATGGAANTGIRPFLTFNDATDVITSIKNGPSGPANLLSGTVVSKFTASNRSLHVEWTSGRWNAKEDYEFVEER